MASKTSIEWTATYNEDGTVTPGFNWNFLRGCSRVSEGCRNCYAEAVAARFSGLNDAGKKLPYFGLAEMVNVKPRWTGEISFHEDILLEPLRWKKPRKVFVNSMSDLFHEKVTDEMLDRAFAVMALTPQHTYQILTKRPERMKAYFEKAKQPPSGTLRPEFWRRWHIWAAMSEFGENSYMFRWADEIKGLVGTWPFKNIWLGVSVEDQKTADERIPILLQTPAAVRWISAEPLLGPIDLTLIKGWTNPNPPPGPAAGPQAVNALTGMVRNFSSLQHGAFRPHYSDSLTQRSNGLDWVVVGGESGTNARPCDLGWVRSIVGQCQSAAVPVFVKQLGANPLSSCEWGTCSDENCRNEWLHHPLRSRKGGDPTEWPEDLRIRQFPPLPPIAVEDDMGGSDKCDGCGRTRDGHSKLMGTFEVGACEQFAGKFLE